jgi:hypothetical protein
VTGEAAEARAMEALTRAGFTGVRRVQADQARRSADVVADRDGLRWAIEVRGASRPLRDDATFEPEPGKELPYPALEDYLELLWDEKRAQLDGTSAELGCTAGLLLVVVEGAPSTAWERALARAWEAAGRPAGRHFGVATSRGLAVYPAL